MDIREGEHVLIQGQSGVGKTTFTELFVGLNEITSGYISVGGVKIKDIGCAELAKVRGIVRQESLFLKMSILDNLKLANNEISESEIKEACKRANCHNFIIQLPHQYDTIIDNNLSFGQLQRISIARVLIQNPQIVIMDEPTSSLDVKNQINIIEIIEEFFTNKTVILVSHTISNNSFDKVYQI